MKSLDLFLGIAMGRRSVRRYAYKPVDGVLLDRLLEAARWAPSPQNRQGWIFTVITDKDMIGRLAAAVRERWKTVVKESDSAAVAEELSDYSSNFSWFESAPVLVVVSARRPETFMKTLFKEDAWTVCGSAAAAAMAAQNLMLAAHSAGLGSCCITGALAAAEDIGRLAGLNRKWSAVCIVTLGHPGEDPAPPPRKCIEEVIVRI